MTVTDEQIAELREHFKERARECDHPGMQDAHARWLRAIAVLDDYARLRAFYREAKTQELGALMSDISEEHWCATWMTGLEHDLWAMVTGGERDYGMGMVDEVAIAQLRTLSKEVGGWVMWNDGDGPMVKRVPMPEWIALDAARKGGA